MQNQREELKGQYIREYRICNNCKLPFSSWCWVPVRNRWGWVDVIFVTRWCFGVWYLYEWCFYRDIIWWLLTLIVVIFLFCRYLFVCDLLLNSLELFRVHIIGQLYNCSLFRKIIGSCIFHFLISLGWVFFFRKMLVFLYTFIFYRFCWWPWRLWTNHFFSIWLAAPKCN